MQAYSSKDFAKTERDFEVSVPEKLIHPSVASGTGDAQFSISRKHPVHIVDLPSKTMSMTLGGLEPGQTTNRHRHTYETLIYVIEGSGVTVVEDKEVVWKAGDAIYIPVWAWHFHKNLSQTERCLYVAAENAPLLQNIGGIALREES